MKNENDFPRHVLSAKCSTCIYRPGNLMHLNRGTVATMTADCKEQDTNVVCHKSPELAGGLPVPAWCRGSVDLRPGQAVRILSRLDMLTEIDDPVFTNASHENT